MSKERLTNTYNPCDECNYSFNKHNQESGMCKLCEFKSYRDLEEQGLLLRLPCRIGDVVWVVVESYIFGEVGDKSESWYSIHTEKFNPNTLKHIGKTVFFTQSEAEEKLRELEGK